MILVLASNMREKCNHISIFSYFSILNWVNLNQQYFWLVLQGKPEYGACEHRTEKVRHYNKCLPLINQLQSFSFRATYHSHQLYKCSLMSACMLMIFYPQPANATCKCRFILTYVLCVTAKCILVKERSLPLFTGRMKAFLPLNRHCLGKVFLR